MAASGNQPMVLTSSQAIVPSGNTVSIITYLEAKYKLGFIDGTLPKPEVGSVDYES